MDSDFKIHDDFLDWFVQQLRRRYSCKVYDRLTYHYDPSLTQWDKNRIRVSHDNWNDQLIRNWPPDITVDPLSPNKSRFRAEIKVSHTIEPVQYAVYYERYLREKIVYVWRDPKGKIEDKAFVVGGPSMPIELEPFGHSKMSLPITIKYHARIDCKIQLDRILNRPEYTQTRTKGFSQDMYIWISEDSWLNMPSLWEMCDYLLNDGVEKQPETDNIIPEPEQEMEEPEIPISHFVPRKDLKELFWGEI